MTVVAERVAEVAPASEVRPGRFLAVLPWLIPVAAALYGLHYAGTPDRYVVIYAAYFPLAVVLPGTLVFRALRGSRGNLPEDLGLGAATGLVVMLAGWALCSATRLEVLLPGWPVLIIGLFLAVPKLRRNWRIPRDRRKPLPVAWSWIIAAGFLVVVLESLPNWISTPLPPAQTLYYQDLMYHLALVQEMTRSMPFHVPQVASDILRYHYLSDADIATGSMITRIPPAVVLLRLWFVPITAVTIVVAAALGRTLTGKWWAGALGGVAGLVTLPLLLGSPAAAFGAVPAGVASPSAAYCLPLVGLLLTITLDVIGGRRLGRGTWIAIFPLALACAGAKSSTLPPYIFGLVLAGLVVAGRYRDRLRATLGLLGLTLAGMIVGAKLFAGGGAGSLAVQPFSILYWMDPFRQTIGADDKIDSHHLLPPGLQHAGLRGAIFVLGLLGWWLILQSPRILGVGVIAAKRARADPAAWLMTGLVLAGTGAMWTFWHPSASQDYFFLGIAPFGTVLTVWLLAEHLRGWRPLVAGLLAGGLWEYFGPRGSVVESDKMTVWSWAIFVPMLRTLAVAALVAVVALVAWKFAGKRYAWRAVPVGLVAAVLGAGLTQGTSTYVQSSVNALTKPVKHTTLRRTNLVSEMRAAMWLNKHSGKNDLIATNVHCQPITSLTTCDARAFWVVGLSGRRALVESWGYTDQAVAANDVNGQRYFFQPPPYPDRYALNQRAFIQGDAADVAQLRDKYHVRWLFADSRALGGVSPDLAKVATVRYTDGPVTVYQL